MTLWTPWNNRAAALRKHRFLWALLSEEEDDAPAPTATADKTDPSPAEPDKPPYWPLNHPCDPEDL